MHYFKYKKNLLYCENIPVKKIADEFGTPLYVYSSQTIIDHYLKLKRAFSSFSNLLICYSVKANSNLSILRLLVNQGAGLDIVSGGELFRAKRVGCPGEKIVYASVGKTDNEIKDAIRYGILMFNVESEQELIRINELACQEKRRVDISLRFNPDIEAKTHKYITTGKKENKFGMDRDTILRLFADKSRYRNLRIVGIHIHIGSQITEIQPFISALEKVGDLLDSIFCGNGVLQYLNIGGGLGIVYDKEKPQSAKQFARRIMPILKKLPIKKLILEPGRFIVGNAGILVTKVLFVKSVGNKKFVIVDGGMNDLIRPALYNAYHQIVEVRKGKRNLKRYKADIVGPVCESGDFLGKERLVTVQPGDYLAVMSCGAYGFVMSSNYNSRPRPAEVLVHDKDIYLIRSREKYRDLIREEHLYAFTEECEVASD